MRKRAYQVKSFTSLVMSVLIIMLGHDDLMYLFSLEFLLDLVITFICVFIVLEYTDRVTHRLNQQRPWKSDFFRRLILQVFFGVLIPSLLAIVLTWLQYMFIYDQVLTETAFLYVELPFIVLIIIITNLVYVIIYLYWNTSVQSDDDVLPVLHARKGNQHIPVQADEILMIHLKNVPCLITCEGKQFILPESLDHYEQELPASSFFRANRQVIISRQACSSYASSHNGKIRVELPLNDQEPVIISQRRAARFRSWIRN